LELGLPAHADRRCDAAPQGIVVITDVVAVHAHQCLKTLARRWQVDGNFPNRWTMQPAHEFPSRDAQRSSGYFVSLNHAGLKGHAQVGFGRPDILLPLELRLEPVACLGHFIGVRRNRPQVRRAQREKQPLNDDQMDSHRMTSPFGFSTPPSLDKALARALWGPPVSGRALQGCERYPKPTVALAPLPSECQRCCVPCGAGTHSRSLRK